jgi:acetolactate synthase-1/2/3 large subunit
MSSTAKRAEGHSKPVTGSSQSGVRRTPLAVFSRTADYVVDALEAAGVDTIYGVPGGAISPIYDALVGRDRFRVVHVRHETSALFMAIGHARMQPGSLPCVLVTSGPGVTNAITGLAAALGEGTPVVVLAGEVPRSRFGRNALQEGSPASIDTVQMVRSVTHHAETLLLPGHAPYQVASAARIARSERGPVFLSLPLDVALAPGAAANHLPSVRVAPAPAPEAVERAVKALRTARRPLVLVGSGAREASASVRAFVERLALPVISTPRGKGIVSERSPLCLGVFGYGGHASAREWLEAEGPDVVLALGCGFSEPSTNSWSPLLSAKATMIQIDVDGSSFGRNYRVDVAIEADCGEAVEAIDRALGDVTPPRRPPIAPTRLPLERRQVLWPGEVISFLSARMPEDTVFTADIGEHLLFAIHHLETTRRDGFIAALGLGSMGSGIGAAVGAKLAAPARPVVSICGDYGFQMFGMEIATAVQEDLDVVFVVLNDGRMRMVEAGVQRIYKRGLAMDGPRVDFAALARAHGAFGYAINDLRELEDALQVLSRTGPTVLDVRIDGASAFPANARVQEISNFTATEVGR